MHTDLSDVGVGENVHEKMDSPQAEALIVRRKRLLELLIVNKPTAILVSHLEARYHVRVGAGRESRGNESSKGASVRRRGWRRITTVRLWCRRTIGGRRLRIGIIFWWFVGGGGIVVWRS